MKKNILVIAIAAVLVFGCAAGATLAWLSDKTDTVTNTFTAGKVKIELTETDADNDGNKTANTYKMIPGGTIEKDPTVTVLEGSEESYVFVKITKTDVKGYLTFTVDSKWTLLQETETEAVYYLVQSATTANVDYPVIAGNTVQVPTTVTAEMLDAVNEGTVAPKLEFTAYAIQKTGFADAAAAWAEASKLG